MAQPDDDDLDRQERLKRLGDKIDALKKEQAPEPQSVSHAAGGAELAWRMVIDLVAGIGIGFGIGYGLDWLFGTIPIFLVVFTLFGFAAGVQSMMRTARAMAAEHEAGHDTDSGPSPATDDDSGLRPAEQKDDARGD